MEPAPIALVVDDSDAVRALIAGALRSFGFDVREAGSGSEALLIAYEVFPAVAIVDQWMPGMTGAELIRHLRGASRPQLRDMAIVGLSGKPGSERDLVTAGASVFLSKPFGAPELSRALLQAFRANAPPPLVRPPQ